MHRPIATRLIRYVPASAGRSTPLGLRRRMAFAEIAAILLDALQHDSAVPDSAKR